MNDQVTLPFTPVQPEHHSTVGMQAFFGDRNAFRMIPLTTFLRALAAAIETEVAPPASPKLQQVCEAERRFYNQAHWGG